MAAKFSTEEVETSNNNVILSENSIIKCWDHLKHKPKCIVFDLDYTLWPYLCDADIIPPFRKKVITENNEEKKVIFDNRNKIVGHFEDVTKIIKTLKEICFSQLKSKHYLAIASKATTKNIAVELMELFGWLKYFDSIQVHGGSKTKHMKTILNELKLKNFNQILFFDDNKSNITQTEALGVVGYQLSRSHGLHINEVLKGLNKFDLVVSNNLKANGIS